MQSSNVLGEGAHDAAAAASPPLADVLHTAGRLSVPCAGGVRRRKWHAVYWHVHCALVVALLLLVAPMPVAGALPVASPARDADATRSTSPQQCYAGDCPNYYNCTSDPSGSPWHSGPCPCEVYCADNAGCCRRRSTPVPASDDPQGASRPITGAPQTAETDDAETAETEQGGWPWWATFLLVVAVIAGAYFVSCCFGSQCSGIGKYIGKQHRNAYRRSQAPPSNAGGGVDAGVKNKYKTDVNAHRIPWGDIRIQHFGVRRLFHGTGRAGRDGIIADGGRSSAGAMDGTVRASTLQDQQGSPTTSNLPARGAASVM